jgi:predicted dehydrogenase
VVATGLVGLQVPRKPFYEKELEFTVSGAWGPGMYDTDYEQRDAKYPLPYVRWTADRNMAEFLELLALGRVRLDRIITHRFPFDRALEAYEMILEHKEPFLGVVLEYPYEQPLERVTRIDLREADDRLSASGPQSSAGSARVERRVLRAGRRSSGTDRSLGIGLIGAGLYARGTLLPALSKIEGLRHVGVSTSTGLSARHVGEKWGFEYCTTDYHELLSDPDIQALIILTRHASHARLVTEALRAGKAVFVEKPLALDEQQLADVVAAYQSKAACGQGPSSEASGAEPRPPFLMVGFNRRFAPDTLHVRRAMAASQGPFLLHIRANAGYIPADSWVHHPDEGGGRIIGELCHYVDLANALTASHPVRVSASEAHVSQDLRDNLSVVMDMADGSVATITYASTGDKSFSREHVEVFGGGMAATIANFKGSAITRGGRTARRRSWDVDRGHSAELVAFFTALRQGREAPVALSDYVATTLTTFAIEASLTCREPVVVDVGDLMVSATVDDPDTPSHSWRRGL